MVPPRQPVIIHNLSGDNNSHFQNYVYLEQSWAGASQAWASTERETYFRYNAENESNRVMTTRWLVVDGG